jgi:hypothetical protein
MSPVTDYYFLSIDVVCALYIIYIIYIILIYIKKIDEKIDEENINIIFDKIVTCKYINAFAFYKDYNIYLRYKNYPKEITIRYPIKISKD